MLETVDRSILAELDLPAAVEAEAQYRNNLLPPQPGISEVAADQGAVRRMARWLSTQLSSGFDARPLVHLSARKSSFGVRPVAIAGLPERYVYRAFVDRVSADEPPLLRSHSDYLRFQYGPIVAFLSTRPSAPASTKVEYVLKTDLAAFYQYIDHGILTRLLSARSTRPSLSAHLASLLAVLEGRTFGLPQAHHGSDVLAELYGQLLEDQMLTRGIRVWRFNDDFRIATSSYVESLDTIEVLSELARLLGLTINDRKTSIQKTLTYFNEANARQDVPNIGEVEQILDEHSLDVIPDGIRLPSDYEDDDIDEELDSARELVEKVRSLASEGRLGDLDTDTASQLRSSLWKLADFSDAEAVDLVLPLLSYAPYLTPSLVKYMVSMVQVDPVAVDAQIAQIVGRVSLSNWQRMWICYLIRLSNMPKTPDQRGAIQSEFLMAARNASVHPAVRAEAMLTLATTGLIETRDYANSLVTEPSALATWYLTGAKLAARTRADEGILRGLAGTSPFYRILLDLLPDAQPTQ